MVSFFIETSVGILCVFALSDAIREVFQRRDVCIFQAPASVQVGKERLERRDVCILQTCAQRVSSEPFLALQCVYLSDVSERVSSEPFLALRSACIFQT